MKRQRNKTPWIFLCVASLVAMSMQVDASELPGYDFHYVVSGDAAVAPVQVFDDGQHLYLQFKNQANIPAVFIHVATGVARMNVHPQFPYFVIDSLSPEVLLKFDGKQAVVTYTGGRALVDGGQSHGVAQTAMQNGSASLPKDTFPEMNVNVTKQVSHFSGELIFVQNMGGASAVTAPCALPASAVPTTPSTLIHQRVSQHQPSQNRSSVAVASQAMMGKENK